MATDSVELELQAFVSHWRWVLGIKPGWRQRQQELTAEPPLQADLCTGDSGQACHPGQAVWQVPSLMSHLASTIYYFSNRRAKTNGKIKQQSRLLGIIPLDSMTYFNLSGLRALRNCNEPNSPVGGGRAPHGKACALRSCQSVDSGQATEKQALLSWCTEGWGGSITCFCGKPPKAFMLHLVQRGLSESVQRLHSFLLPN